MKACPTCCYFPLVEDKFNNFAYCPNCGDLHVELAPLECDLPTTNSTQTPSSNEQDSGPPISFLPGEGT